MYFCFVTLSPLHSDALSHQKKGVRVGSRAFFSCLSRPCRASFIMCFLCFWLALRVFSCLTLVFSFTCSSLCSYLPFSDALSFATKSDWGFGSGGPAFDVLNRLRQGGLHVCAKHNLPFKTALQECIVMDASCANVVRQRSHGPRYLRCIGIEVVQSLHVF